MITHPAFSVEPWAVSEDRLQARGARPGRVGLRALQRPHRPAREPRRGRAVRPARHLPQRLLRDPPAAVRGGRLRLPGGRPDRRQRHQRQAHPAAGRRRAVRHPLRRAARPHALAGPARGRASAPCSLALAERPRDRGQLHPPGLVRAARPWPRSATRSGRSTTSRCGSSPSPSSWPTSPTPSGPATRAPRPRWRRRSKPRSRRSTTCASCSCTARATASCGWRRAWTTSSRRSTGSSRAPRRPPTSAACG